MGSGQIGRYSGKMTGGRPPGIGLSLNGRIPLSKLVRLVSQTHGAFYLAPEPAKCFEAMVRAAARDGVKIVVRQAYRPIADQIYFWNLWKAGKGNLAAKPGTSNHGLGGTVDINRTYVGAIAWMRKNAIRFGFDIPIGLDDGIGQDEPWHWQFIQGFKLAAEILVAIRGVLHSEIEAYRDAAGSVWVEARDVMVALGGAVLDFPPNKVEVSLGGKKGILDFINQAGVGYIPARELQRAYGLSVNWDGKSTVSIGGGA